MNPFNSILAACRRSATLDIRLRRQWVAEELGRQLESAADSEERIALAALGHGDRPVLVSGQQAGLAGGVLLVLVKALGLLALADRLESVLGKRPLCIFWLEGNDHDWREAAMPGLPAPSGWMPAPPLGSEGRSVGHIQLDDDWLKLNTATLAPLFQEWSVAERRPLWESIAPGTLVQQSRRLLRIMFPNSGLLFLDPSTTGMRKIAVPLVKCLQEQEDGLIRAFRQSSADLLASGGVTPVDVDSRAPWFLEDEQGRRRRPELGTGITDPLRFSPNVLTRPLLQDWLLDPAAALLGPTELRYHQQLAQARVLLDLPGPMLLPRPTLQLLSSKDRAVFDNVGLDPWVPPQAGQPWNEQLLLGLAGGVELKVALERLEWAQQEILALCRQHTSQRQDLEQAAKRQEALGAQIRQSLLTAHKSAHRELLRDLHARALWQDAPAGSQERRVNGLALVGRLGGGGLLRELRRHLDPFHLGQQRFVVDPTTATIVAIETLEG